MENILAQILATPDAYEIISNAGSDASVLPAIEQAVKTALGLKDRWRGYTIEGCSLGLWAEWRDSSETPSIILVFKNDGLPMIVFKSQWEKMLVTAIPLSVV
jgi:hypothetical protein